MKRFFIWAGILASLLGPANAAGTVPGFSLTPQFDTLGKVMPGCKLYVIQAATTQTPQNSYQDSALTIPNPNPLLCDATGRLPVFYLADGVIKFRLTNQAGSQQFIGDNLPVIGASSGGGGGGTVDPTTIIATGDLKCRYGTGVLTGFVRTNGRTIGSATSGATERANADSQALFEYLWNADPNLSVSSGRGASSNADWVANKTIALPDGRGRAWAMLDDMGNSAAGRITSTYFGASATTLGQGGGFEGAPIILAQLPNYSPAFTGNSGAVNASSPGPNQYLGGTSGAASVGLALGSSFYTVMNNGAGAIGVSVGGNFTPTGSISSINGNQAQIGTSRLPPMILTTCYAKL